MHYFLRALREAAKSWPLLVAALVCSAGVAALWGANIAALFPIIEVTLKGESLQSWNERRIVDARARIAAGAHERTDLEAAIAAGGLDAVAARKTRSRIDTLTLTGRGDEAIVASAEKLGPWLERFLPSDPFQTVLVVVAFVVVSTFLKHVFLLTGTLLVSWVAMNISRNISLYVFEKDLELERSILFGF
jgi:subfamily B ATP-binding cassette protein MsbA